MELILHTDDEAKISKLIDFANGLNVTVEKREAVTNSLEEREAISQRIMNFKQTRPPSIEDPMAWEREQREDRDFHLGN